MWLLVPQVLVLVVCLLASLLVTVTGSLVLRLEVRSEFASTPLLLTPL